MQKLIYICYLLFQGLISANSVCWWNPALTGAVQGLSYRGYVAPGALLVSAELCALEVVRNAWARRVLQPPPGYQIISLGMHEIVRRSTHSFIGLKIANLLKSHNAKFIFRQIDQNYLYVKNTKQI